MSAPLTARRWAWIMAIYAALFLAALLICPFIGRAPVDAAAQIKMLLAGKPDFGGILLQLRLPRILLALLAGGTLALVGACFQVILRNPLADPFTLGITGGSAVGAVLAISVPGMAISGCLTLSFGSFGGLQLCFLAIAAVSLGLAYILARHKHGASMRTLLLTGAIISILFAGIIMFIRSMPGLAISLGSFSTLQLFSLIGAAISLGLVYVVARRRHGMSMNTLLLAGVTISILSAGTIMLIRYIAAPYDLITMDRWLMGGLDIVGYREMGPMLPLLLPGIALMLMQAGPLNHLSLGEEMAAGHGVQVAQVQRLVFIGGGLATAAVVSLAGPIGFVGLIIPHAVRRISGYDQRIVLPASFLLGGAFLALCDTVGRTLFTKQEIPVGVITAIVGGVLFIKILLARQR